MDTITDLRNLSKEPNSVTAIKLSRWLFALVVALAAASSLQAAGIIKQYTSRTTFVADDAIDWGALTNLAGSDKGATVKGSFTGHKSAFGTIVIGGSAPGSNLKRFNEGIGFFGNFTSGDRLLATSPGDPGPLTITFDSGPVYGAGLQIESVNPGPFTGQMKAFDSAGNLLGTIAVSGAANSVLPADNAAPFMGIRSSLKEIARLEIDTPGIAGFVVNRLELAVKPMASATTVWAALAAKQPGAAASAVSQAASSTTVWAFNASFGSPHIQEYDTTTGVALADFVAPHPDANRGRANGRGIAVVGTKIYYSLADTPNVYVTDTVSHADLGIAFKTILTPGINSLSWDGTSLWMVASHPADPNVPADDKVYQYSPTGQLLKTLVLSRPPNTNLARDGIEVTSTGIVANRGSVPYDIYDFTGTLQTPLFITATFRTTGIAFDGSNYIVSDVINGRLAIFDGSGTLLRFVTLAGAAIPFGIVDLAVAAPAVNACQVSNLPSVSVDSTSQSLAIGVTAAPGCTWAFTTISPWVTLNSISPMAGNGVINVTIAANGSVNSRVGLLSIAGQTFTLNQAGAVPTFILTPLSTIVPAIASNRSVAVTPTPQDAAWTATSNAAWITIASGAPGTGNGTVAYAVAANASAVQRSGTLTIAGQTFTVTQSGTAAGSGPVAKAGVFRSGFLWLLDVDGNQQFNTPPDKAFGFGGIPGDIPITGDWNGSGTTKVGVYRSSNGLFILDYNGDGLLTADDKVFALGVGTQPGDVPVVGDWNGSGTSKVGIFRQGFFWILDTNGNGVFEQGIDDAFAFGGVPGDVPVVGDWNGTGTSKVGIFRAGFLWILDTNNNHTIDAGDQVVPFGGVPGDVPIVGDWNGDGRTKVGVFRMGFFWVLDTNGNQVFDAGTDQAFPFGGLAGDKPVVGKW